MVQSQPNLGGMFHNMAHIYKLCPMLREKSTDRNEVYNYEYK